VGNEHICNPKMVHYCEMGIDCQTGRRPERASVSPLPVLALVGLIKLQVLSLFVGGRIPSSRYDSVWSKETGV